MERQHQEENVDAQAVAASVQKVRDEIARVIVGQDAIVEQCLIALLAGGHVLLEGVPGLGKTELVKSLARSMS